MGIWQGKVGIDMGMDNNGLVVSHDAFQIRTLSFKYSVTLIGPNRPLPSFGFAWMLYLLFR